MTTLDRALKADPKKARRKNIEALVARGQTHYERDEFDKAIADLTAALALAPKCADALLFRGRAYFDCVLVLI